MQAFSEALRINDQTKGCCGRFDKIQVFFLHSSLEQSPNLKAPTFGILSGSLAG